MANGEPTGDGKNGAVPHECDDRREFQYLVGCALAICLGLQGVLMWKLMGAQPPDSSWDLIKSLMAHLGQVDVLLIGGLLGMAQQQPKRTG